MSVDGVDGDVAVVDADWNVSVVLMLVSVEHRTGMPTADDGGNGADVLQGSAVPHSGRGQNTPRHTAYAAFALAFGLSGLLSILLFIILLFMLVLLPYVGCSIFGIAVDFLLLLQFL